MPEVNNLKTKKSIVPPSDIFVSEDEYGIYNLDKIVQLFWWCSVNDKWEWFDFKKAFNSVEEVLRDKLGEHNLLPRNMQRKYYKDLMKHDFSMFKSLIHNTFNENLWKNEREEVYDRLNEIWIERQWDERPPELNTYGIYSDEIASVDSVEQINKLDLGEEFIEILMDYQIYAESDYDHIKDIWEKIAPHKMLPKEKHEKIILFDEIIDLYHQSGYLFDTYIIDIDDLRTEFESYYT